MPVTIGSVPLTLVLRVLTELLGRDTAEETIGAIEAELWDTDQVADFLGYKGDAANESTRRTLGRWGITAVSRKTGRGGQNLYDAAEIRAAKKDRPGRGARTDLRDASTP